MIARAGVSAALKVRPITRAVQAIGGLIVLALAGSVGAPVALALLLSSAAAGPISPAVSSGAGGWMSPVAGSITSGFGPRARICGSGGCTSPFHAGVDIANDCGTRIVSAAAGRVTSTGRNGSLGNSVVVEHEPGLVSIYSHAQDGGLLVAPGDVIAAGDPLALMGSTGVSTGCHLDLRIRVGPDLVDPVAFLSDRGVHL